MTTLDALHQLDLDHHIHPFTNLAGHQSRGPLLIDHGDGPFVVDAQDNRYFECVSGLWSAGLGFSEHRLADVAYAQMKRLPYYHSFTHKAHSPGIELAAKLVELTPETLNHVFYTNSGSEAVDTAVKMVWYVNNALGRRGKKTFLARRLGYHGSTVASGSLTGLARVHDDFDLPAIPVRHLTTPNYGKEARPNETEVEFTTRLGQEMQELISREGAGTIAAFIGEPVMGAGGVLPPPVGYWTMVQRICKEHDILLVLDEVITGFGRMGRMFGLEYYGITPDILVLSKQLTSSYQSLGAVIVSDELHDALVRQSAQHGSFGHGFTNTGHPVATAVALETLRIIETEDLVANAEARGAQLRAGLTLLEDHAAVLSSRGAGFLGAVELVPNGPAGAAGLKAFEIAHKHGLILRAVADALVFCPPLISSKAQIDQMLAALRLVLDDCA